MVSSRPTNETMTNSNSHNNPSGIILFNLSNINPSIGSISLGIDFYELTFQIDRKHHENNKNAVEIPFSGFMEIPVLGVDADENHDPNAVPVSSGVHCLYWNTELQGRCSRFFNWDDEYCMVSGSDGQQQQQQHFMALQWKDEELQFLKPEDDAFRKLWHQYMNMELVGQMKSYQHADQWDFLSNFIDERLMKQLRPASSSNAASPWIQSDLLKEEKEYLQKHHQNATTTSLLNSSKKHSSHFTPVPQQIRDKSLTPAQITQLNFDKSLLLERLLQNSYEDNQDRLLGEVQYAFVSFVVGHCYDALQQWQNLLNLLCQCNSFLQDAKNEPFWKKFILVFYHQLKVLPQDFMLENESSTNFLFDLLCQFFDLLDLAPEEIQKRMKMLRKLCEERFECSFELQEDDEYAPSIQYT